MQKNLIIAIIITAVTAGGLGFYFAFKYFSATIIDVGPQARFSGRMGGSGAADARMRFSGGGNVFGEVITKDATSMTLKLRDGGSRIVFYSDTTPLTKTASGTIEELVIGQNVIIGGKSNEDGSISADSIQLAPSGFPGRTEN